MIYLTVRSVVFTVFSFSLLFFSGESYAVRYYHDGYQHYAPYVCYKARYKVRHSYYTDLFYRGCHRSYRSCSYSGSYHFGRYSSRYAVSKALRRCSRSAPRFVD
jgi:hypothetical protein